VRTEASSGWAESFWMAVKNWFSWYEMPEAPSSLKTEEAVCRAWYRVWAPAWREVLLVICRL